jgi:hypothetical protein
LQGAMDVAALLKDRYNTKVFDAVMDKAMADGKLNESIDEFKRNNALS